MASEHKQHKRAPVAQHSAQCRLCRETYTGPADRELLDACELCRQEVCEKCSAHRWLSCDACDGGLTEVISELERLNARRQQLKMGPRTLGSVLTEAVQRLLADQHALEWGRVPSVTAE